MCWIYGFDTKQFCETRYSARPVEPAVTRRYGKLELNNSARWAVTISSFEIQAARTCIYSSAGTGTTSALACRVTTELIMYFNPLVFSLLNHRP